METVALIVGIGLLGRGAWVVGDAAVALWRRWLGHRGRVMTWAEYAAQDGTGRVVLAGRAEAGPQGPLASPLSQTPCVWWSVGDAKGEASAEPFVIRGDGGAVTVRVRRGRVRWAEPVGGLGKGTGHGPDRRERVLREGAELYVSGTLAPGPHGPVLTGDDVHVSTPEGRASATVETLVLALVCTFGALILAALVVGLSLYLIGVFG
ncbi:hypothetical protein [Actinocorallia sp. A-T 12471]|uniref:hypothetical protein n=1 Tax=Actinocorallia sp. A-T 12471 TaxID=3089813 RepID=UPI0029D1DCBA|nr:hypothetical protein [Actinocorallia sp. A-T 12471]MDX6741386.1 hypothetical protein [Actinocorallia sp. A-T 12471]